MNIIGDTEYFYTPTQIADILQVQRRTVYIWIRDKKLSAVRAGKIVRIHKQAFDEFLTSTN
jgi:excisionase family DNA binding protein